ncbi:remorin 1.4-like [Dendrobium catenatum]|uniref:remorin 1.4-like n=1 Tax=Dendrobium catenatum TaxID=906689 RepID=UPI00109F3F9C|nr:remorin 1.4-like [Dendrobium catenatum]
MQTVYIFCAERKKATSWFQRQFSDQKGGEDDSVDLDFGAAIAAAAYAIMLAEEGLLSKKKPIDELGSSLTRSKSRREDSMSSSTENRKISRWFSAKQEDDEHEGRVEGNNFKRKPSTLTERMKQESAADLKMKEKEMNSAPRIKKTPTFSDKYLNDTGSKPFESERDKQSAPYSKKPMPSYFSSGFPNGGGTESTNGRKRAYHWEQATMEKIRKRHEKMNNTILQWENEKKVKAKRRMERKERKLEMKRTKILQEFREEMKRIDMIASGARAVADDEKRRAELKAKEKAKKMQATVKVRRKCFCF